MVAILEMNVIKINRNKSGHHNRERDPFYQSKGWKIRRKDYFSRFPWCIDCLAEGIYRLATILDHIWQRSLGGPDFPDDEGFRGLCKHHDAIRQARQSNRAK